MKRILRLLLCCLLMTACAAERPASSSSSQEESIVSESVSESSSEPQSAVEEPPPPSEQALDEERANEIMCIFGAHRKTYYDEQGEPIESDIEEYETAVISFYYGDDELLSADDITPYGFFGWYLQYTLLQDEKIAEVFPGFERFTLIRNDPVSGEIFGAPGDFYEAIVTAFFDVDAEQLRGDDLYDEANHAYVPITGPGIGERPTVRVAAMEQKDDLIVLDILVEGYEPVTFELTVREDKSNELAGIKFVSLRQNDK